MVSHQLANSLGDDLYNGYWYKDLYWTTHYHRGYEFVWIRSGRIHAVIGGKEYSLGAGEALFVTPYMLHSYESDGESEVFIAVFSGNYIGKFASAILGKEPIDASFSVSDSLACYLCAHMACLPDGYPSKQIAVPKPPFYVLKASLYAVCAEFFEVAEWRPKEQNNDLIFRMIAYVEEHYSEDITLVSMAEALSYEYHYLSRILRNGLHMRFCTFVNQYRCERARELIVETDMPLSIIALNCGFQSIRSFNRVFLKETGATPTEVRKGK